MWSYTKSTGQIKILIFLKAIIQVVLVGGLNVRRQALVAFETICGLIQSGVQVVFFNSEGILMPEGM